MYPGKRPLTAMFRLKYWLEQVNRKDEQWYYLKLDISKYFYRISHRILKKILAKKIKDQRLLKLLESIIDCKHTPFGLPPGRSPGEVPLEERLFDVGMPIGNLLSQVFANVYLDALDQFCKRELQIHCYVRYMDDVIILSNSKAQLQEWKVRIASFLEVELELQLNNKTCIRPINQGIEFVGYRVWPDKVVLRKKTTLHIKRVLKAKKEAYRVKEISFKQATDTLQSYLGMMKYCDCDALKEKILNDFVLTHADMKQIYEEGGDRDENYYRRGDGTAGNKTAVMAYNLVDCFNIAVRSPYNHRKRNHRVLCCHASSSINFLINSSPACLLLWIVERLTSRIFEISVSSNPRK